MHRIFHPEPLTPGARIALTGTAARHVAQALRLRTGDALVLFDGRGGEYPATVETVQRREIMVRTGPFVDREAESPLVTHLAQGISRGERMDYTIRKAVELGVASIQPLFTDRCQVRLTGSRLENRLQHWRGVAIAACEQCGRNRVPAVHAPRDLMAWLESPMEGAGLVLDPGAGDGLRRVTRPDGPVTLLTGPEGGLDEKETAAALAHGLRGVHLGPRILRTETAGVAALAAIQGLWGDLG